MPHGWSDFFAMCEESYALTVNYNDNGVQTPMTGYQTSIIANHTVDWLATAGASAAAGGPPFFAYMAIHAPHLPSTPAPWYANASFPLQAPRMPNWNKGWEGKHWQVANPSNGPMRDELIRASDILYGNRLRTLLSVDDAIEATVATLAAAGVLDNTYIIYTSDHGYHLGSW